MKITIRVVFSFFVLSLIMYILVFIFSALYLVFQKEWMKKAYFGALGLGCLFHLSMFSFEWYFLQAFPLHKPELVMAWLLFGFEKFKEKEWAPVNLFAIPIIVAVMFVGLKWDPKLVLSTAHQSHWLVIHVAFTWFAFGCFAIATVFSILYLIKFYFPHKLTSYNLEEMDKLMYKLIFMGLIFQIIMMAAGMIWAKNLFGRYWNWDKVEVWALIVMLYYSFYLHLRVFWKVKGKLAAWLLLVGFFFLIISLWGLPYLISNKHLSDPLNSLSR